jgi:hypothetical protein
VRSGSFNETNLGISGIHGVEKLLVSRPQITSKVLAERQVVGIIGGLEIELGRECKGSYG